MLGSKQKRKPRRKFLRASKFSEMAGIDTEKLKLERYFVPMDLGAEGSGGRGQLDRKVVAVDEAEFYLHGRSGWKDNFAFPEKNYSDYSSRYEYEYSYEDKYHSDMHDDYEL